MADHSEPLNSVDDSSYSEVHGAVKSESETPCILTLSHNESCESIYVCNSIKESSCLTARNNVVKDNDGMNEYYDMLGKSDVDNTAFPDGNCVCICSFGSDKLHSSYKKRLKGFSLGKRHRSKNKHCCKDNLKKKKSNWGFKLNCTRNLNQNSEQDINSGICSCVNLTPDDSHQSTDISIPSPPALLFSKPVIGKLKPLDCEKYPFEGLMEKALRERAREIAEGVDPPPGYRPPISVVYSADLSIDSLSALFGEHVLVRVTSDPSTTQDNIVTVLPHSGRQVHTQIDFIHCLVPDLLEITNCSFYWGKIDRYQAEKLLEGQSEGTFLLRDSAQEEYLFSVSFRRYKRSLHARIEQWNHLFSFDAHDPGVYSSTTVCGLIEHYKDPSCCLFFEPMLTLPLHRNFTFTLQHLCRAVITKFVSYDNINQLRLPKSLKSYLKEYHYKQKVRVRQFDYDH